MLEEMLRAEAASAMEYCALPNHRLRIQKSDIYSCGEIRAGLLNPDLLSLRPGSELKARLRSKSKVRQIGIEIRIGMEIVNGRYIRPRNVFKVHAGEAAGRS
ncbi:hypothetical protein EVAR_7965_1 [Eumeta japonica]|uniref:Uncharacterized protein n=1 Tax=Eumeta variegata TaxID=151549 RepID=A0A4C1TJZ4_EUMVA|nr:hypothetical protein EVAR_7965_1 [Eumeta japonica]